MKVIEHGHQQCHCMLNSQMPEGRLEPELMKRSTHDHDCTHDNATCFMQGQFPWLKLSSHVARMCPSRMCPRMCNGGCAHWSIQLCTLLAVWPASSQPGALRAATSRLPLQSLLCMLARRDAIAWPGACPSCRLQSKETLEEQHLGIVALPRLLSKRC